jgi:hypothetical protein
MYATATKMAMGEELDREEQEIIGEEQIDEITDKQVKAHSAWTNKAMDQYKKQVPGSSSIVDRMKKATAHYDSLKASVASKTPSGVIKTTSSTVKEETIDEATPAKNTDVADKSYLKTAGKKPGPLHNVGKGLKAFLQGKPEPKESVELDGNQLSEDDKCVTKPEAKGIAKGEVKKHEKKMHEEEVQIDEAGTVVVHTPSADSDISTDTLAGRVQGMGQSNSFKSFKRKLEGDGIKTPEPKAVSKDSTPARKSVEAHGGPVQVKQDPHYGAVKEAKGPEQDNVPFAPPYGTSADVVKDKSGAKHTPMSRAKDLARTALKRMKKENLLGKAPGNN